MLSTMNVVHGQGSSLHDPSRYLQHQNFCITLSRFWAIFGQFDDPSRVLQHENFCITLGMFWAGIQVNFESIFTRFWVNFIWISFENSSILLSFYLNLTINWAWFSLNFLGFLAIFSFKMLWFYYQISLRIGFSNQRNISLKFWDFIIKFSLIWPCYSNFIFVSLWSIFIQFW